MRKVMYVVFGACELPGTYLMSGGCGLRACLGGEPPCLERSSTSMNHDRPPTRPPFPSHPLLRSLLWRPRTPGIKPHGPIWFLSVSPLPFWRSSGRLVGYQRQRNPTAVREGRERPRRKVGDICKPLAVVVSCQRTTTASLVLVPRCRNNGHWVSSTTSEPPRAV